MKLKFTKRYVLALLTFASCFALGNWVIRERVQVFQMASSSAMESTLMSGDRILVDKKVYESSDPIRGDIVAYRDPETDKVHVFRLVGLPGETLRIRDGSVFINRAPLQGPPWSNIHYSGHPMEKAAKIPSDSYYVLGDNSRASRDSRYIGFIPMENIIGKVYRILHPFDRMGPVE